MVVRTFVVCESCYPDVQKYLCGRDVVEARLWSCVEDCWRWRLSWDNSFVSSASLDRHKHCIVECKERQEEERFECLQVARHSQPTE